MVDIDGKSLLKAYVHLSVILKAMGKGISSSLLGKYLEQSNMKQIVVCPENLSR